MKAILLTAIWVCTFFTFSQNLEHVLKLAGRNKPNLERVLEHYKNRGDKEKYNAAVFLIQNMPIHKYVDYDFYNQNGDKLSFSEFDYPDYQIAYQDLKAKKETLELQIKRKIEFDLRHITADYLIRNIDEAFKAWKNNPWSKAYSFEVFCEYILPQRNLTEALENWRADLKSLIVNFEYPLEHTKDPINTCTQVINGLQDFTFTRKRPDPTPILSTSQMLFRKQGSCPDLANFAILVNRAVGVATSFDFTPHYAASSNRHFWNSVVDQNGKHIAFNSNAVSDGENDLPYLYRADIKRLGKVYRKTYSIQKEAIASLISPKYIPERMLWEKNLKDVTDEYVKVSDLNITQQNSTDSIAFLNVYNLGKWKTIGWGKAKNKQYLFKKIGRDLVYLPSIFKSRKSLFYKFPFLLDKQGKQRELKPNTSKTFSATLSRSNELKTNYIDFNTTEIEAGKTYALKYWTNGWKTLDSVKATERGVYFEHIPTNALFTLVPKNEDHFERVFVIESKTHKIIWY